MKNQLRIVILCSMFVVIAALSLLFTFNAKAGTGQDWDYDPYTPAIKRAAIAQGADLISTAMCLTLVDNAVEGNPLQWYTLPAKAILIFGVLPLMTDEHQVLASKGISDLTYGAVVNNLLIVAGAEGAIPMIGGILTATYLLACDARWLPLSICPFTENVLEEITRLYLEAEEEGRTIDKLLFQQWEMDELVELVGHDVKTFNGIALEVIR